MLDVSLGVGGLPIGPGFILWIKIFPSIGGVREAICGEDGFGGNGHKSFICDGELGAFGIELRLLEQVDVLGDALGFGIIANHLSERSMMSMA